MKLFGDATPDHPLADAREARRLIDALRAGNPTQAIDELSQWQDSLRQTEGFAPELLAERAIAVDDAARPHLARLAGEYFATPGPTGMRETRLWTASREYWRHAALAFAAAIDRYAAGAGRIAAPKSVLVQLAVRALRAFGEQMKWQHLRYGPLDESLWGTVCRIYALAESGDVATRRTRIHADLPGESSPRDEFVKAVMLSAASPDSLSPRAIELAWRLTGPFQPHFSLVAEPRPDVAYWIDLQAAHPPQRLARPPQPVPSLRFFAVAALERELHRLIDAMTALPLVVPAELGLGGAASTEAVLALLRHLERSWSHRPPERRARRHTVKTELKVTHGFEHVVSALDPQKSSDFDYTVLETWATENISAGGLAAFIPALKGDWLKLGALVAVQPQGSENWLIGAVRRLHRTTTRQGTAGIETLARNARLLRLEAEAGAPGSASAAQPGILLDSAPPGSSPEVELVVPARSLADDRTLRYDYEGRTVVLFPLRVIECGDDYTRIRYRQMAREASA